MCLLVLAWHSHPRYRLVVAANRDEFHARPAAPLALWPAPADILAGRDLRAGGTWLALDRQRRFGVVTNFRELQAARAGAPSRGGLIPDYLHGASGAGGFLSALAPRAAEYSGFNLLLSDGAALWYGSNRATPLARALAPGVYGLANELLDTPWPKLTRVRAGFERWLCTPEADPAALFVLLADRTPALSGAAPATGGLPAHWARALSAPFVQHPEYGTRCSTVLLLGLEGQVQLSERRFDAQGELMGESEFVLAAGEWP
jgi:uncharacterized protein with NRDE domain